MSLCGHINHICYRYPCVAISTISVTAIHVPVWPYQPYLLPPSMSLCGHINHICYRHPYPCVAISTISVTAIHVWPYQSYMLPPSMSLCGHINHIWYRHPCVAILISPRAVQKRLTRFSKHFDLRLALVPLSLLLPPIYPRTPFSFLSAAISFDNSSPQNPSPVL